MQVCPFAKPVVLTPVEITELALAIQGDTAQWAADVFQTQPFNAADKLVCQFAIQATDNAKAHETPAR